MKLKAFVSKLEDVPEEYRAMYVQDGERFRLDAEGVEDVSGLKSALEKEKRRRRELEQATGDDFDPEEFRRLKTEAAERARKDDEAKGNWAKLEQQLKDLHAKELAAARAEAQEALAGLSTHLRDGNLTSALVKAGAKKGMLDLLVGHGAKFVDVRKVDGRFVPVVVDATGTPKLADGAGTPMGIDGLVEQVLKAQYPDAFEGSGSSGGGASRSAAGGSDTGTKVIAANDPAGFLAHVEEIAKGKVEVQ